MPYRQVKQEEGENEGQTYKVSSHPERVPRRPSPGCRQRWTWGSGFRCYSGTNSPGQPMAGMASPEGPVRTFQSAEQGKKMCILEIQLSLRHATPRDHQGGPMLASTADWQTWKLQGQVWSGLAGTKKVAKGPMMEMPCPVAGVANHHWAGKRAHEACD